MTKKFIKLVVSDDGARNYTIRAGRHSFVVNLTTLEEDINRAHKTVTALSKKYDDKQDSINRVEAQKGGFKHPGHKKAAELKLKSIARCLEEEIYFEITLKVLHKALNYGVSELNAEQLALFSEFAYREAEAAAKEE